MSIDFDKMSDEWLEGFQGNKIGDHANWYPEGTQKNKDWQAGHDYLAPVLDLERVTIKTEPGGVPPYSMFGYVIDKEGTIYTLQYRYYHGIVCALLYPDLARTHEAGVPIEPRTENSVLAFQRFEHDNQNNMQVIRIAFNVLVDSTYFSKGKVKANSKQIASVLSTCKVLGYKGREKIQTEYGEQTVAQIIECLQKGDDE